MFKPKTLLTLGLGSMFTLAAWSQQGPQPPRDDPPADNPSSMDEMRRVSPARGINHPEGREDSAMEREPTRETSSWRTWDGSGNNLADPEIGAAHVALFRMMDAAYEDGFATLVSTDLPNPRTISNEVFAQDESLPNPHGTTDFLWQWGQFLDHDLDLTDGANPPESWPIEVPAGDPWFDPEGTGEVTIRFNRSLYDPESGVTWPREQLNEITAWIDASNVYGSSSARARALRTLAGDGKLKVSEGDLLPFNDVALPNAGGDGAHLFMAGDVRANEQVGLTVMHTLFVREHNRLAEQLRRDHPDWSGNRIYQKARQLVGAEMQVITYREYLPALLGEGALSRYEGYDPSVNASIANCFSTAAYRYGHSALNATLLRLDADGNEIEAGHLPLREAFFNPGAISGGGGLEPVLRGLAAQVSQTVDAKVIDDVRNFLFGQPGSGGFDLASLNIQRGRDHGLPRYNDALEALGFPRATRIGDINPDRDTRRALRRAYDSVNDVDLWVGGLSEVPLPGSQLGPLFHAIVVNQFEALRNGDRYWYALHLSREEREMVESLTLADIIRLNTDIGGEIQNNVFYTGQADARPPRQGPGPGQ